MPTLETTSNSYIIPPEHCDVYGHMNNGWHPHYFNLARETLLEKIGWPDKRLKEQGIGLLIHESLCKYKAQVFPNEEIIIVSGFEEYIKGPIIAIKQEIMKGDVVAAIQTTKNAFYDFNAKKPMRTPPEWFLRCMYAHNILFN